MPRHLHRKTLRIVTYNIHRCRGMDGRTVPQRAIDVLAGLNADVIALQEVIGAGPERLGARRGNRRGARHGLGDGVGAPPARPSVRQRRAVALSRSGSTCSTTCRGARASRAAASAPTSSSTTGRCTSSTCISARPIASGRIRPSGSRRSCTTAASHPPKILLGDFNEWSGGLATAALTSKLEAIDLSIHLRRKRTYPGILPFLHLDHIYYEGQVEIAGIEIPRTRKSLMASDHLPFLAELKVGFE